MGARPSSFKRKLLASSISSCLMATAGMAFAQEQNQGDGPVVIEEVQVLGIRASIAASMDVKRDASGVVDAITAEDMGKFPDTNLAESLQRITGVSISREGGEGSQITVRGFGPNENLVTQNGRLIASTTGERGFNFANIASEMVAGVQVYKTTDASQLSGAGGALVNISSRRPLNNPGQQILFSAKAVDDSSTEMGGITPEITGIYSNTFADDTVGVSVGVSYQERENGLRQALVETGWRAFAPSVTNADAWGGVPVENQVNRPTAATAALYTVPQEINYRFTEEQRERLNGQLVLQWEPNENILATADFDYFQRNVATQHWESSSWFGFAASQSVWTDGPVAAPLVYSETYGTNPADVSAAFRDSALQDTGMTFGLNLAWQVNESLGLTLDVAHSEAEQAPDSPFGSSNKISTAAFVRTSATGDFTGDFPVVAVGGINNLAADQYVVTGSWFNNTVNTMDIDQIKLDGNFEFNDTSAINFGVSMYEATNRVQEYQVQRNDWSGVGTPGQLTDAFAGTGRDIFSAFDGSVGDFSQAEQLPGVTNGVLDVAPNDMAAATDLDSSILNQLWMVDFATLRDLAEMVDPRDATDGAPGDCGTMFCPSTNYAQPGGTDRETVEETQEVYLQYVGDYEVADMPLNAVAGLRYVTTDVTSTAVVPTYNGTVWSAPTEIILQGTGAGYQEQTGSYSKVLPALTLSLEPMEDVVVRAAYSKSIVRPTYEQLLGGINVEQVANQSGASGSTGNPDLEPRESDNIDLSFEWYYSEDSFASVGLFRKELKDLIQTQTSAMHLFDLRDPTRGPLVAQARAAVADPNDNAAIRQYIADNFIAEDSVSVDAAGNIMIAGTPANDPLLTNVTSYSNSDDSRSVSGAELNVQHLFGDTGFGAIFNYTLVDTDVTFDVTSTEFQTVIPGVSDTMNIVAFYENYGFGARIAYNWREEFLTSDVQGTGNQEPVFEDAFAQWDLDLSYSFSDELDGLRVFLQGINITDEANTRYGRNELNILRYTETGARWQVGASYVF